MSVRDLVQAKIEQNTVMVFGKSYCGYCMKVKRTLKPFLKGVPYEFWDIDKEKNGNAIQTELLRRNKKKTVPQVFINQEFKGGSEDIDKLNRKGELSTLIPQTRVKGGAYN